MAVVGVINHGLGLILDKIRLHSLSLQLAPIMGHRNLDHRIQVAEVGGMAIQGFLDSEGKQEYSMTYKRER